MQMKASWELSIQQRILQESEQGWEYANSIESVDIGLFYKK
jgi:hypothetical protein